MIARTAARARQAGLTNVTLAEHDFVARRLGAADESADYVMLFNILHAEQPDRLLAEARRVLRPEGTLAIMHWNYDASTPRGPTMDIRPRPEQCLSWARLAGFRDETGVIELPPYHYGAVLRKSMV
jgi:ubiquinone/menaquinone biosynthesis C-methylase UbiE